MRDRLFDASALLNVVRSKGSQSFGILNKHCVLNLTVYDALYLAVAEKTNLVLVTDYKELERVAKKYVKVMRTGNL